MAEVKKIKKSQNFLQLSGVLLETNLKLEEGDIIYIPREQQTVRITGQVLFPTIVCYDENYILTPIKKEVGYDLIVTNIEGNPSTGKKKGQIAAFDFAYIQFADNLDIRCLHFILHDQLENIHDNQLNTLVEVANSINGQYIVPILRDKIPTNINISQYEILSLSQDNKLFKI